MAVRFLMRIVLIRESVDELACGQCVVSPNCAAGHRHRPVRNESLAHTEVSSPPRQERVSDGLPLDKSTTLVLNTQNRSFDY